MLFLNCKNNRTVKGDITQIRPVTGVGILVAVILGTTIQLSEAQDVFEGLGDLPGGTFASLADFTSLNGNVIVGRSSNGSAYVPFIWTPESGMTALDLLPESASGSSGAIVNDMSDGGDVIVGHYSTATETKAFVVRDGIYTAGVGALDGNYYRSLAISVSDDGDRILGYGATLNNEGAQNAQDILQWTESAGWQVLLSKPGITYAIIAFSGDGNVIYGYEENGEESTFTPFRWTSESGLVQINLPIVESVFITSDISYDGTVLTGIQQDENFVFHAATWSVDGGSQYLNSLPESTTSRTFGATSDANVIGGFTTTSSGSLATLWTNGDPQLVQTILENSSAHADLLTGWTLTNVIDISSDGRFIVGSGINPDGNPEAWRADLGCILLLGKTLPAECECSVPEYAWVPGQGILFSSGSNWNPEGPPSDSALAIFDVSGFIPVEFLSGDSTEALEVTRGRVELDLNAHEFIALAETDCLPGIRIEGASTELLIKGDEGVLRSRNDIAVNSGTVTITEGTALNAPEVNIGSSGRTSIQIEHGFLTATEVLRAGTGLQDSTTIVVSGSSDPAFLHLGPQTDVGVNGFARIEMDGNSKLFGPILGSLENRPLHIRLGVHDSGHGELYIDGSSVDVFSSDFGRDITMTVGDEGYGVLALSNDGGMTIDFLNIGGGGDGEVILDDGVLVVDSTLTMGGQAGSSGHLTLTGDSLDGGVSVGDLVMVGLAGEGTITVEGNSTVANALSRADTSFFFFGAAEGAEGNLIMTGPQASLVSVDSVISITVGARGRGDVQLTDGARIDVEEMWVGRTDTGFGSMYVGSGSAVDLDRLAVGTGAFGVVQVEEDALVTADLLWVADNGQIIGDVLTIGTFEPGKRATAISARGLLLSDGADLDVTSIDLAADAILGGTTTWQSPLLNSGGLMPGDFVREAGMFTAASGYEQTETGLLDIQLGGDEPGVDYDQLKVFGTAVLDGTLKISAVPGLIPDVESSFTIVEADTVVGTFSAIEVQDGLEVDVLYTAGEVTVTVTDVTLVASEGDSPVVARSKLNQNYPNPFSGQTNLSFTLAEAATVELEIFDLLGRNIWSSFVGSHSAGTFDYMFDGSQLPSGTYLCRMTAVDQAGQLLFRESKTMMLIR